jgi:3-carboxy-cis,cis-muconate cycloisomerase
MRRNLHLTGGLIMAEPIAAALAEHLGREEAHNWVRALSERVGVEEGSMREVLLRDETVRRYLSPEDIERMTSPAHYLGSTQAFIDRALAHYRGEDR